MNIRERNQIKTFARRQLEGSPQEKKLVLTFSGITMGLALLVTLINHLLDLQIDKTGGLSNMSTRAVLDTIQQVLPMVQTVIAICLELGYLAAMLRIARGQFVSLRTLKLGFDRFWPLLRLTLVRGSLFVGLGMLSIYLGTSLFLLTPLSDSAMELMEPALAGITAMDPSIVLDDALYSQLLDVMIPCFALCIGVFALLAIPMWYSYRLSSYILIDKPGMGAFMALRESKHLMRRNRFAFFRLDLSLWYYYGLLFLTGLLAYGDLLLGLLGVTLPVSATAAFYGFYVLYLLCQMALFCWLRNRVEVSYCLAYDSLLPKEPEGNAVVLGNIFQM